jgi:hypothetical protein
MAASRRNGLHLLEEEEGFEGRENGEMKKIAMLAAVGLLYSGSAWGLDPAVKCEADKNKFAGKYAFCRQKAEAFLVKTQDAGKYGEMLAKCDETLNEKWDKIELKAGTACVDSVLSDPDLIDFVTAHADAVAAALAGGALATAPDDCGNAVVDAGESCDFGTLGGGTCDSATGSAQPYGTLSCGSGCSYDTSGCSASRYVDNGDGTVSDLQTGLMWQQTDDAGGLTDKDNLYIWSTGTNEMDGTAFTVFLSGLNGGDAASGAGPTTGCYAGHCDWRLPLIEELTTIVDLTAPGCGGGSPCIDQAVFGPTQAGFYWSASTLAGGPGDAWVVSFAVGFPDGNSKSGEVYVRAVRTGS